MKLKSKKSALLMSFTSLLLCFAMLAGSTFAWFTDTATTGVNKIVSGKLDVGLEMKDADNNWVDAEGKTLTFKTKDNRSADKIFWEPNCTYELPELRVVNKGNLALKAYVYVSGIQSNAGDAVDLRNVIEWKTSTHDGLLTYPNNDIAIQMEPNTSQPFNIEGHMKASAGNEYQGLTIDSVSITVYATQLNSENDSFGPNYDKDAPILYPENVTNESFADATQVYYYSTYGGAGVKTATGNDIASHPAVVAYMTDENNVVYAADLRAAIEQGASVLYCKENATVSTFSPHINVVRDLTIYANGANFGGGDLSIHAGGGNYTVPENNENTINIYNAKNLVVWGEPQTAGRVWNVNFYDCVNEGFNFFMYRGEKDKTDTFHLTMTNCLATGYQDSIVHATADGSIVIKNCVFTSNCAPVNIAHKQSGTLTVLVEDSKFINCGKVNLQNDYFAPARFVNNNASGTLEVTLKNNTFTNTVGTNGDILLGDYRATGKSFGFTAKIETDHAVMVKSSEGVPYSSGSAEISVAAY